MTDEPFVNSETGKVRGRKPELAPEQAQERDPDANAVFASEMRRRGEEGAATRRSTRANTEYKPPSVSGIQGLDLVPTEETEGWLGEDALANAAMLQAESRAIPESVRKKRSEMYLFTVLCLHGHHGIYFTEEPIPGSPVSDDKWYSTYKRRTEKVRLHPYCQVCKSQPGQALVLLHGVTNAEGLYTPETGWVYMVAKDPTRRRIEGTVRAYRDRMGSNNEWIARKTAELEAAGMEVFYG